MLMINCDTSRLMRLTRELNITIYGQVEFLCAESRGA